jgi:uncharacterized protein (TIGR03437 family)
MCTSVRAVFFLILIATSVMAAGNQFVVQYVAFGTAGSAKLLAVDASGNFFVVGTVTEPSGRPQIRAIKTDPQGNEIASFDFGGSSFEFPDAPMGAAVDPQGNLVIVGNTNSQDFPLVGPPISKATGGVFIVKLDSQLTKIVFSTLLGWASADALTLDAQGNIYVTGSTGDSDFPVTPGAFQTTGPTIYTTPIGEAGPIYAFLSEISADGTSIIYSTFFGSPQTNCDGGSSCIGVYGYTGGNAIAVDQTGTVLIGGSTTANQLPVTPGTLGQQCDCEDTRNQAYEAAGYLAKFAPGGKELSWATYINPQVQGGNGHFSSISIAAVAMDADGNVVFGGSGPYGLVVTNGALQSTYPGGTPSVGAGNAGYVAKINSSATSYLFSTYFGGLVNYIRLPDGVLSLALDPQGDIWITGGSESSVLPFPSSAPAFGETYIAELSADGSSLLQGTTAPGGAAGVAIALLASGSPAVLGSAGSLLLDLPNQPATLVAVENSAGVQVTGNVAPLELVSLYGSGLGPANTLGGQIVKGALTTSLGGVQVLFNNVAAPLLYVGPTQINAIVPSSVFGHDTANVQVITPNGTLAGPTLSVVPSEPEVFQSGATALGGGAAVALNQDGTPNSASSPARSESIVTIWATGAGGTDESFGEPDGYIATAPGGVPLPVSVLLGADGGATSLEVLYAGNAPGMVTAAIQVNFRLPPISTLPGENQYFFSLQVGGAASASFGIFVAP